MATETTAGESATISQLVMECIKLEENHLTLLYEKFKRLPESDMKCEPSACFENLLDELQSNLERLRKLQWTANDFVKEEINSKL